MWEVRKACTYRKEKKKKKICVSVCVRATPDKAHRDLNEKSAKPCVTFVFFLTSFPFFPVCLTGTS